MNDITLLEGDGPKTSYFPMLHVVTRFLFYIIYERSQVKKLKSALKAIFLVIKKKIENN